MEERDGGLRWEEHGETALGGMTTEALCRGDMSGKNERGTQRCQRSGDLCLVSSVPVLQSLDLKNKHINYNSKFSNVHL